jgi:hypothetical protein
VKLCVVVALLIKLCCYVFYHNISTGYPIPDGYGYGYNFSPDWLGGYGYLLKDRVQYWVGYCYTQTQPDPLPSLVSGLVEQMDTMETRLPQPTISSVGDSILAFPSYNGIDVEKYIEWETNIDCLFAKYFMCERKKYQKGN